MPWRSDMKNAPRDGTEILTYRAAGLMAVAAWFPEINRWVVTDGCDIVDVTHWQPLPDPPDPPDT